MIIFKIAQIWNLPDNYCTLGNNDAHLGIFYQRKAKSRKGGTQKLLAIQQQYIHDFQFNI